MTIDKRRYPRAQILRSGPGLAPKLMAKVVWPNGELSDILDLSYKGLAAGRPGVQTIATQDVFETVVHLGDQEPFAISARVKWLSLDVVGLEIQNLPAFGHAALTAFLDAGLLGVQLRSVSKLYFSPGQTFDYWYQGPRNTHVFIWLNSDYLVGLIQVDLDGEVYEFQRQPIGDLSRGQQRALMAVSQIDRNQIPIEDFFKVLGQGN